MRRFFVAPEAVQGNTISFDGELAHHMGKVLRLTAGEQVTVCTGDGAAYVVELQQFSKMPSTALFCSAWKTSRKPLCRWCCIRVCPRATNWS